MVMLSKPKARGPANRRFPLSVLALAAVLEGREDYAVVDGNLDPHPTETIAPFLREAPVELVAVTAIPGPQPRSPAASCRALRARFSGAPAASRGARPCR